MALTARAIGINSSTRTQCDLFRERRPTMPLVGRRSWTRTSRRLGMEHGILGTVFSGLTRSGPPYEFLYTRRMTAVINTMTTVNQIMARTISFLWASPSETVSKA